MIVYEVLHFCVGYDGDTTIDSNIFYTYDEAYNYYAVFSESVIAEYKQIVSEDYNIEENATLEEIDDSVMDFYYDNENLHSMPYLYISYDTYGTDKLFIKKQKVMHFDI